jgi:PAS domain-containing protein
MAGLLQATHQVKKNILLIRLLLAVTLYCFAFIHLHDNPEKKLTDVLYALLLALTFLPFFFWDEKVFEKVRIQYIVYALDLLLLMGGLYLFNYFATDLLIIVFLTFFISAISQSVGRSLLVGLAMIGFYVYLVYFKNDAFNYLDPVFLLSCILLLVVAVHSGYLAYRTVQEEKEITELAKKTVLLSEKVREGDQAALDYAATLKNVLDTLPIGAIAVAMDGTIVFANAKVGKLLDINPNILTNRYLYMKDFALKELGERMAQSMKDRQELKREYIEVTWKNGVKRFRLDSSSVTSPSGKTWGVLFLIQEASHPSDAPRPES